MKLRTALEIGQDCGLTQVSEALFNIRMHAMNIFNYGEERKELEEMYKEFKESEFSQEDKITDCLAKLEI